MGFSLLDDEDVAVLRGTQKIQQKKTVTKKKEEPAVKKPKNIVYKTAKYEDLVHMNKVFDVEGYDDFNKATYPHSLNFYDFEVFMCDWMVVIINPIEKKKMLIVNDAEALRKYYSKHKNEFWVGYNSRNYDTFILKSILLGLNPKKTNDMIITYGMKGWQINDDFRDIQLLDFDVYADKGLKQLEGFLGNDIRETEVPFDLDRVLTKAEIRMTAKYCMHDVEQTIEVFRRRKSEYDAHIDLINTFELKQDLISGTKMSLVASILDCKKQKHDDEFELKFVDTLRIKKYKDILKWFQNPENMDYKKSLKADICGVPHQFGWGGIHGCPSEPLHRKGKIFHVDVTSYYPSIMIRYNFLTRNCKNKNKFTQIYDKRVELKKAGKKKEQAPYKIVLNGTYGICKDKYSPAYDPQMANNVCVNGQLMLLDLLEHLEGYADIIQSNTDGIILQVEDNEKAVAKMREICQEWIDRTGMGLGFDEIDEIWQKDVNNYVFRFTNGKLEKKGAYVKELNELDYDLPIVNECIVKYLTENILPEDTVNSCNELKKFQKIVKVNGNYVVGWHNGEYLTDRTYRVFASRSRKDTYIGRCKAVGATVEKFANTPDSCFIWNEDVNGVECVDKLDKQWYIDLAEKRIEDFGIKLNKLTGGLF